MRLNLGCADTYLEGFVNVDIAPTEHGRAPDVLTDLSLRYPWEDSTVEFILAQDFIEHIADRIHTMNEIHRVLMPGGKAEIIVPSAVKGAGFVQDPTHKSQWCLNSFQYYRAGSFATGRLGKPYGITARFNVLEMGEKEYQDEFEPVWKIRVVLEAVK